MTYRGASQRLCLFLILLFLLPTTNVFGKSHGLRVLIVRDKDSLIQALVNMSHRYRLVFGSLRHYLISRVDALEFRSGPTYLSSLNNSALSLVVWYLGSTRGESSSPNEIYRRALSKLKEKRELSVLFYSSDGWEYSLLASYLSLIKSGKPVDLDKFNDTEVSSLIDGSKYVTLVTPPIYKDNVDRLRRLIRIVSTLDDDPYIDLPYSLLTALSPNDIYNMLLSSELMNWSEFRGVSLFDSIPLLNKMAYIASSAGLKTQVVRSDAYGSNLTVSTMKKFINGSSGILYINLHGNPEVMAPTQRGPIVLSYTSIPNLTGAIILTFSCNTLKFNEITDPSRSIAYNFISKGASAYIGSNRVEYLYGREVGTSYPDMLLLMMLREGMTIGEAVMVLNNMHIKSLLSRGLEVEDAAYEVLIGDPTLKPPNPVKVKINTFRFDNTFKFKLREPLPSLYLEVETSIDWDKVKLEINVNGLSSFYHEWYADHDAGDRTRVHIYLTTSVFDYLGNIGENNEISLNIYMEEPIREAIPYIIMLVTILLMGIKASRGDLKN